MTTRKRYKFAIFLLAGFLAVSCIKKDDYPPVPAIKYVSFTKIASSSGIDELGVFKISFTDGDGNLGLSEIDTFPPFNLGSPWYYNFFIDYYEKQKGEWKKITLPNTLNSRIPRIVGSGPNKPSKGTIEIELFFNNPFSVYDTIMLEASICDRDLQMSNVVRSEEIIVKKH